MHTGLRAVALCFVIAGFAWGAAFADEGPTNTGPPSLTEQRFVQDVRTEFATRFAHPSDAERAGYVRYTAPDSSGAISYADKQWNSDPSHPSQVWYDSRGTLLGVDFSVPRPNSEPRPHLWGVDPGRWVELNGHVHYVTKNPANGAFAYDLWVWNSDFTAAGGNLSAPSADTLVKLGRVKDASDVAAIFEFPTQWDLIVWIAPNPHGPFSWE